jgi:hypothetical protein
MSTTQKPFADGMYHAFGITKPLPGGKLPPQEHRLSDTRKFSPTTTLAELDEFGCISFIVDHKNDNREDIIRDLKSNTEFDTDMLAETLHTERKESSIKQVGHFLKAQMRTTFEIEHVRKIEFVQNRHLPHPREMDPEEPQASSYAI